MSDLTRAVEEATRCSGPYELARCYYEGKVDELHANRTIKRLLQDSSSGFKLNYARRTVDAVLDRLKIASVAIPGRDEEDGAAAALTARLNDEVWDANHMGRKAKLVHRTALVCGDSYLLVWDTDGDGSVQMYEQSPDLMRVYYDPEYPDIKHHAAKVWRTEAGPDGIERTRVNLYYADRIERWITKPGAAGERDEDFEQFVDEEGDAWPIANPYGEVPVFHFRTDSPYGRPEHRDAYGPQNAINKVVATMMSSVDFQGYPQRYVLREAGEPTDPSGLSPDDSALPGATESESKLEASPGSIWDLMGVTGVGQLPAADPKGFLSQLQAFVDAMAATTVTPARFMNVMADVPSGEALRAAEAPLVEKIKDRQTWFAEEWRDVLRFAMKIIGAPVDSVIVEWYPPVVENDSDAWGVAQQKRALGVPEEVIWQEAGYRPEQYQEWVAVDAVNPDEGEPDG